MSIYQYPGYLPFVRFAASDLNLAEAALLAGRQPGLAAMDGLICDLTRIEPDARPGVFEHVRARRDALAVAHAAAEKILADVASGLGLEAPEPIPVGAVSVTRKGRSK